MRSRWLSTFTIVGVLLIALGVVALVMKFKGHHFVFDPGQTETGSEPAYYILVGILMVVNGLVSPITDPVDESDDSEQDETVKAHRVRSPESPRRKAVAPAADRSGPE